MEELLGIIKNANLENNICYKNYKIENENLYFFKDKSIKASHFKVKELLCLDELINKEKFDLFLKQDDTICIRKK